MITGLGRGQNPKLAVKSKELLNQMLTVALSLDSVYVNELSALGLEPKTYGLKASSTRIMTKRCEAFNPEKQAFLPINSSKNFESLRGRGRQSGRQIRFLVAVREVPGMMRQSAV